MKAAKDQQRNRSWLRACLCGLVWAAVTLGFGADPMQSGRLEDYLKLLHYAPVAFKANARNEPLLEAEIKGKKMVLFVDTGWRVTTLTPGSAAGLKTLGELGVELEDTLMGKLTNTSIVLIDKLTIGGSQFLNQPAETRKLQMDYVRVKFGGILGCDFLFRNFCLIDCGARQIYFRSAKPSDSESKALEETLQRSGFAEVNLKWRNGLAVEAAASGQPLLLLVDTGATWSVLDDSQVPRLQLKTVQEGNPKLGTLIPEDLSAEIIGFGKIGAHQMRVTTLQTLQIGARIWKDVHVGVANLKAWGISEPGKAVEIQGLFGAEMLAARGALIDFASEKLWLRPEKSTKPGARSP